MTLEEARRELDRMDEDLIRVFLNRMRVSEAVGEFKAESGQSVFAAGREEEIMDRIRIQAEEMLGDSRRREPAEHMRSLMRQILQLSREYQYDILMPKDTDWEPGRMIRDAKTVLSPPKNVAVQGGPGSYQSVAAARLYPDAAQQETQTWEESCQMAQDGTVDLAILPLENTTAGPVNAVYDLLQEHNLYIVASCTLPISHCLLGVPGARLEDIQSVVSIPQALSQCTETIRDHGWTAVASTNTAHAAREVAENGEPTVAAIASSDAADVYGLNVLLTDLNDATCNQTRFVFVSNTPVITEDADRVSLILHLADRSGMLASVLNIFADRNLNLEKIQSRPMPDRPWEYSFYLDFFAQHNNDDRMRALVTLYQLAKEHPYIRLLGWYRGA